MPINHGPRPAKLGLQRSAQHRAQRAGARMHRLKPLSARSNPTRDLSTPANMRAPIRRHARRNLCGVRHCHPLGRSMRRRLSRHARRNLRGVRRCRPLGRLTPRSCATKIGDIAGSGGEAGLFHHRSNAVPPSLNARSRPAPGTQPYFRCCARYLFISNIVTLSLPKIGLSLSSAKK